ncbi:unnamed protein product [Amoebophrya sp. A120]|nr:unnamed protein product [Amoebophrya sp. A120]|eukprot:GSA120T00010862001.1
MEAEQIDSEINQLMSVLSDSLAKLSVNDIEDENENSAGFSHEGGKKEHDDRGHSDSKGNPNMIAMKSGSAGAGETAGRAADFCASAANMVGVVDAEGLSAAGGDDAMSGITNQFEGGAEGQQEASTQISRKFIAASSTPTVMGRGRGAAAVNGEQQQQKMINNTTGTTSMNHSTLAGGREAQNCSPHNDDVEDTEQDHFFQHEEEEEEHARHQFDESKSTFILKPMVDEKDTEACARKIQELYAKRYKLHEMFMGGAPEYGVVFRLKILTKAEQRIQNAERLFRDVQKKLKQQKEQQMMGKRNSSSSVAPGSSGCSGVFFPCESYNDSTCYNQSCQMMQTVPEQAYHQSAPAQAGSSPIPEPRSSRRSSV